jgi:hypothetical protein
MIARSYIDRNLIYLDRVYRNATSTTEKNYCSKIAILELCGWIELSMDDIVLRGCVRALKQEKNRKAVREKVKHNYGFEYQKHFVSLITSLVGFHGYETLEKKIPTMISVSFKSELGNLKVRRNSLAHTYYRGVTPYYDAPSITMSRYLSVANGLDAYDQALRSYC